MATIRELIAALEALTQSESDETQQDILTSLVSGDDTAISVLLALLSAVTTQNNGASDLLLAVNGLRADLAGYNTNTLTAINDGFALIDSTLQLINTKMLNTYTLLQDSVAPPLPLIYNQLLRIASNQLALACVCDGANPALPPPLDVNSPTDLIEHCRRVQYLFDHYTDAICGTSEQIANGVQITAAIAATLFGAGVIPGIDLAAIPAALIAGAITILGIAAAAQVQDMCNWLTTHSESLINTIYNAGSAADAQSAWQTYVNANTNAITELDLRSILTVVGWAGLFNELYNQANEWDTSAYSGSACGVFNGCQTFASVATTFTGSGFVGTQHTVTWLPPGAESSTSLNTSSGMSFADLPVFVEGDAAGYTIRMVSGAAKFVYRSAPLSSTIGFSAYVIPTDGLPHGIPAVNGSFFIFQANDLNEPFSVEICPNDA